MLYLYMICYIEIIGLVLLLTLNLWRNSWKYIKRSARKNGCKFRIWFFWRCCCCCCFFGSRALFVARNDLINRDDSYYNVNNWLSFGLVFFLFLWYSKGNLWMANIVECHLAFKQRKKKLFFSRVRTIQCVVLHKTHCRVFFFQIRNSAKDLSRLIYPLFCITFLPFDTRTRRFSQLFVSLHGTLFRLCPLAHWQFHVKRSYFFWFY